MPSIVIHVEAEIRKSLNFLDFGSRLLAKAGITQLGRNDGKLLHYPNLRHATLLTMNGWMSCRRFLLRTNSSGKPVSRHFARQDARPKRAFAPVDEFSFAVAKHATGAKSIQ